MKINKFKSKDMVQAIFLKIVASRSKLLYKLLNVAMCGNNFSKY
jgi:hypothetical protein